MNYNQIVQDVIEEHKLSPIDILGTGDAAGEYYFMNSTKDAYIRTVRDINDLLKNSKSNPNILEIGSFLGPVSISLKRIGFSIYALDLPEFYQSSSLRSLYEKNDIPFAGINLREYQLPYESNYFDAVIICAVIEHFNFNPLPVLKEINRVLKKDGYIYIGMPNQSRLIYRMKLLFGKSIHPPIDHFFLQLDRNSNMVVGLHWREYTLTETVEMIEKMGFKTISKYYFPAIGNTKNENISKTLIKKLVNIIPSFRTTYVVIGKKIADPTYDFWLTDANT